MTIPNVVGLDDQAALAALGNAGLSGTEVQRDSTEPQGKVLSQSPAAGKQVARGSQVTIFASTGAITVPNVIGQPRKAAVTALKKAGFVPAVDRGDHHRPDPGRGGDFGVPARRIPGPARRHRDDLGGRRPADLHDAMKVAVLGGGISSEHEVSLRIRRVGGRRAAGGGPRDGRGDDRARRWLVGGRRGGQLLARRGPARRDVAFPVLHGPGGEDGSVQGLLEVLDVPYAGSDVEASAVCMDKLVFKDLLARHGVPQVDYCRAGEEGWRAARVRVRQAALGEAGTPRLERRDLTGLR